MGCFIGICITLETEGGARETLESYLITSFQWCGITLPKLVIPRKDLFRFREIHMTPNRSFAPTGWSLIFVSKYVQPCYVKPWPHVRDTVDITASVVHTTHVNKVGDAKFTVQQFPNTSKSQLNSRYVYM